MADPLQGLQGLGGGTEVFGGMGGLFQNLMTGVNYVLLVFVAILIIAGIFGVMWIVNEYMLSYKTAVTLKYEVGNNIIKKKKKFRVRKKGDKIEVQFSGDPKLMAEVPDTSYMFFSKGTFGSKETYEGFVRNNQITWVDPKPVIGMMTESRTYKDGEGQDVVQEFHRPTFITMKSNLKRYFMDTTRKNMELSKNLKWWQNPQVWAFGMMSVFLIGVLFMFLMNRSTAEMLNQVSQQTFSFAEKTLGQVVS